jgi:hypothetical protein
MARQNKALCQYFVTFVINIHTPETNTKKPANAGLAGF